MKRKWKLSERKLNTNLLNIQHHNINNCIILNKNTNKTSIYCSNTTLNLGGLETFGVEDNIKEEEENLLMEEVKSYAIIINAQKFSPRSLWAKP